MISPKGSDKLNWLSLILTSTLDLTPLAFVDVIFADHKNQTTQRTVGH